MVKKGIDYYYLTLYGNISSIEIEEKDFPIIGVFLADDEMHDIVTAKLIEKNFEERIMNKLSYISLSKVSKKEIKQIESLILGMNDKEREIYFDKLSIMEFRLRDEEYLRSSFGIGDKMSRKLIINSSINPNKKGV